MSGWEVIPVIVCANIEHGHCSLKNIEIIILKLFNKKSEKILFI